MHPIYHKKKNSNINIHPMTNAAMAQAFSTGNFEICFNNIAENAQWHIVGEQQLIGRISILEYCNKISAYFNSITKEFHIVNIIEAANKIAINGTADFYKDNLRIQYIESCDIYEFNSDQQIQQITSYCIASKGLNK